MANEQWTDGEVLRIREQKKELTIRELAARYSLTTGQVRYALYTYKIKNKPPFWESAPPKGESLRELLRRIFK
jgi:hypothetical protein